MTFLTLIAFVVAFGSGVTAAATNAPAEFADGTHHVGTDVVPGTYVADLQDGICYVTITDSDQEQRNPTFIGRAIVTISIDDSLVETSGCGEWRPRDHLSQKAKATQFGEGMYEVGVDIKPGTYIANGNQGRCVWFTVENFNHRPALDNLISWWKVGDPIVEIPADGTGFYSFRCGTWELRHGSQASELMTEFDDGSHIVGLDIAPGIYTADSGDGLCDWFRTAPFGDTSPDNTGGYASVGIQLAQILPTDTGFYSRGCGPWKLLSDIDDQMEPVETIGSGTVAIGTHVQTGVYVANAVDGRLCRWFILSGFAGRTSDIASSGNGVLRGIVDLTTSSVGFRSSGCGEWTMVEQSPTLEPSNSFGNGEHIINIHIMPGIYSSPGPDIGRCLWRRITGFDGTNSAQIAVRHPVGRNIAEITDEDTIFESFGCGKWEIFKLDKEHQPYETFDEGTWAVNAEIEPGTYVADIPDGSTCFWSRLTAFTGEPNDFVATDVAVEHSVTTVRSYDAGFYSDGCGRWYKTAEFPDLETVSPSTDFPDGVYIVGRDISPGTYLAAGIEGEVCFWSRLTGFDGDPFNRMNIYASQGQAIATILPSDAGFRSFGCGNWSVIGDRTVPPKSLEGTIEVGVDIEPGTYIASDAPQSTCKWRRLSNFTFTTGTILESLASGQRMVTIRNTDVGFASFGCGVWSTFVADDVEETEALPSRFSSGSYVVGLHINPGTYYSVPRKGGGCRWSRVTGFSGDPDETIARGESDTRWVVTVDASDTGFVTHGCGIWRNVETALEIGPFTRLRDGVYRIEKDILPGTYVANAPTQPFVGGQRVPKCRWQTVSGFSHTDPDVIAKGSGVGNIQVTITDSAGGFVSSGCGGWQLIASQR